MRHRKKTVKLGRTAEHRNALLANQVCSLILNRRIRTTLAKAKAARPLAEKMVTLGKRGDLHARRLAVSCLRQQEAVKVLFESIAPAAADRKGGYTRIVKLGARASDASAMAYLEWVDFSLSGDAAEETVEETRPAAKKPAKKKSEKPAGGKPTQSDPVEPHKDAAPEESGKER